MEIIKCMKNKLLPLVLLLSGFVFGQNVELLKNSNNSDSLFTRDFSLKLFPGFKILPETALEKKYKIRKINIIYSLINNDATDKEISDYINGYGCDRCVSVEFQKLSKGANGDLGIKGTTYFVFKEARGKFLQLFPFWQTYVQPEATTDKTYESHPSYIYKNSENNVWYNFIRLQKYWVIRNMSDRSKPWTN